LGLIILSLGHSWSVSIDTQRR